MTERPHEPGAAAGTRLVVGLIRGLHGLRGGVRVEVLTDDPARFEPGTVVFPEGTNEPLTIVEANADGPGLLVWFKERTDRTTVEDLRGRYLEAPAPTDALPDGSFYWHEVTGLAVEDLEGGELGRVVDVFRAGGSEVFVVQGPRGELLVPAVSTVVRELAPDAGRLVVDADALGLDDREPRSRVRGRRTTRARKAAERGEGSDAVADAPAEPPS
ncbi:MAG: ribosome maturation factor RimM [Candidatus Limnocylindrales bacterium]